MKKEKIRKHQGMNRKGCRYVAMCSARGPMDTKTKQHPTWRIKVGKACQWGSGGWEEEAFTPPRVLLRCLRGLCSMSRLICMIFVADLTACRLNL